MTRGSTIVALGIGAVIVGSAAYAIGRWADVQETSLKTTGEPVMDFTKMKLFGGGGGQIIGASTGTTMGSTLIQWLPLLMMMIPMMMMMRK
jgi:hypothetical protein